ncbi:MAG: filamentation induced by cAMP protein Fic [Halothiobacillaceae bacterium]|nr:MAG: filamentation induced by cAMP protein Fic [Halothiobacillaceae bacterium]
MKFLEDLDRDIRANLLAQLRNLWTHTSTALEGNTLTLGETAFVIEEGLTVSGKPLKDHAEVVGHARAIELVYETVTQAQPFSAEQLFKFHQAVQTTSIADIYSPVGAWKTEPNGTYAVSDDGKQQYLEYATPADVPLLMEKWLALFNELNSSQHDPESLLDGNGRLARLVANIPVIKSGYPPILIDKTNRREYIQLLARYELAIGQPQKSSPLLTNKELLTDFKQFCQREWQQSLALVESAREQQKIRRESSDLGGTE